MRRLVVFGDSFVEGYVKGKAIPNEEITFVEYLGNHLGIDTVNQGVRGHSDFVIAHDVIRYINNRPSLDFSKDCAFLISFSGWRRGFKTRQNERGITTLHGGVHKRLLTEPVMSSAIVHQHQVELAQNALVNILTEAKIPFLFTNSFQDLKLAQTRHPFHIPWKYYIEGEKTNNTLQNILKGTWLKPQKKETLPIRSVSNSIQLQKEFGNLTHKCGHPTRAGHFLISKTLEPYIKNIIK